MIRVTADLSDVIIVPSTELEEIVQNVKTILSTVIGEVPLDREFGTDRKILDLPISVATAKISAAIVKAINKFEPRARVTKINYTQSKEETLDGILKPVVDIELVEEKLRGYVLIEGENES